MTMAADHRHGHANRELNRRPALAGLAGILLAVMCITACGTGRRPAPAYAPSDEPMRADAGGLGSMAVEAQDPVLSDALAWLILDRSAGRLVAVANRYYQMQIRDKAFDYYSEAVAVDHTHAGALDGRARVLRDWGFTDEALEDA